LGTKDTEVTVPNLSGSGTDLLAADADGTLRRTAVSADEIDKAVNQQIPKLESAARGLGKAVESTGAIAAAMSAIPEVTLRDDEPVRCGVGTGGYGSQYAMSAGCAVRVGDRLHLNGALSYSPSVDYAYGSTPSIAGRLGFSFPLGKIAKATTTNASEVIEYRSEISETMLKLKSDVQSRDQQIDALTSKLEALMQQQNSKPIAANGTTQSLINHLRSQIDELNRRDTNNQEEIAALKTQLSDRDQAIKTLQEQVSMMLNKMGLSAGRMP
jgi:uncharacterized coiled-coil protein SlyX